MKHRTGTRPARTPAAFHPKGAAMNASIAPITLSHLALAFVPVVIAVAVAADAGRGRDKTMTGAKQITVQIKTLPHFDGLTLPKYSTEGSSGIDLLAASAETVILKPGERGLIPTGLIISLPPETEAQIRPRSGLAIKHGITLLNTPGTIDADYRGEIQIIMINLGQEEFSITRGMRIAQMVIARVVKAGLEAVDNLDDTRRGAGGFGHTGH